jgi:hypothetical protein
VLSRRAIRLHYDRSLFARLMEGGYPTFMLDTQVPVPCRVVPAHRRFLGLLLWPEG